MALPTANFKSIGALSRFVLVCVLGLAADLYSKSFAFSHMAMSSSPPVDPRPRVVAFVPGWVHFEITTNKGAVFGLGQGQRALFLAVSAVAIAFLSYLFATSGRQRFYQVVLGMLLAGVLGNMYDRVLHGEVRDMIHALPGWKWPGDWQVPMMHYPGPGREVFPFIFNVADVLLCVGVGLMVIYSFAASPEKSVAPGNAAASSSNAG